MVEVYWDDDDDDDHWHWVEMDENTAKPTDTVVIRVAV